MRARGATGNAEIECAADQSLCDRNVTAINTIGHTAIPRNHWYIFGTFVKLVAHR
jgi:hypothetical protein